MKTPITSINYIPWTNFPTYFRTPQNSAYCIGTFMTNFSRDHFDIYREAVELYEQRYGIFCLYVHDKCSPEGYHDGGSLHYWRDCNPKNDLSDFWKIFDQVKLNKAKLSDPCVVYDRAMKGI